MVNQNSIIFSQATLCQPRHLSRGSPCRVQAFQATSISWYFYFNVGLQGRPCLSREKKNSGDYALVLKYILPKVTSMSQSIGQK